ncbi:MAG: hypothetical protein R3C44_24400 [Chloroflexota bacterium]
MAPGESYTYSYPEGEIVISVESTTATGYNVTIEVPPWINQSASLAPTDDAYVDESAPTTVSNKITLYVSNSPTFNSYLKFDLGTLAQKCRMWPIQNATLRITPVSTRSFGGKLYQVSPYYAGTTTPGRKPD